MDVDLSSLARAIARLEEAYVAYSADPKNMMARDSVVVRFLFTYELGLATLRRYLDEYSIHWKTNATHTTPEMIRTANQDSLLKGDWEQWSTFRDKRNQISHTYNEDQAIAVVSAVPAFLEEVRFLHNRMEVNLQ
jgi:nucleotidyltransferase substrate binding protein (TIGR01987 family)